MESRRRRHALALFAPLGPTLRPGRRRALVRPGSALAPLPRLAHPAPTAATCSTSRREPVSSPTELVPPDGAPSPGVDQSPEMLAAARAPLRRPRRARPGVGRVAPVRRRVVRPPHVHVSAALRRRSRRGAPRARARRPAGRHGRDARVRRCRAGLARPLWELYVRVGLPARGPRDLAGLARGRAIPRPVDPRLLAPLPRARAARALARRRASRGVRARRLSLGGGIVVWGTRSARETRVLRASTRRLARLRDAAAPAVHRLASLLRRRRRLPRPVGAVGPARV